MFTWLQKDIPIGASIFFRGTWPCNKEGFFALRERGIEITEGPADENAIWSLELKHPSWGEATLVCFRDFPLPPHTMIEWDPELIETEQQEIKACGTCVSLMVNSRRKQLLRDRKNALFFMDAVMGEEGVAAIDHVSQKFWPRAALKMEVMHDADVDAQSLFTAHYVRENEGDPGWYHTHGLGEIGLVDFDIMTGVAPSSDAVRAVAHAIMEGTLRMGGDAHLFAKSSVRAAPVAEFMEKAPAKWRELCDRDEDHTQKRVVLCEPAGKGLLARFKAEVRPAEIFLTELPDDTLIHFSNEATDLMAARAKSTYSLLRSIVSELAEYEPPALVKLGYRVDGGSETEREHLWFQVHEARESEVDATLLNQPFGIERMNEGDRGMHSIENLSDWQVMTPGGPINPRQTKALRFLREAIAKAKGNPAGQP